MPDYSWMSSFGLALLMLFVMVSLMKYDNDE